MHHLTNSQLRRGNGPTDGVFHSLRKFAGRALRRSLTVLVALTLIILSFPSLPAKADVTTDFTANLTADQQFYSPSFESAAAWATNDAAQIPGGQFIGTTVDAPSLHGLFDYFAVDFTPSAGGAYSLLVTDATLTPPLSNTDGWGYVVNGDPVGADDDTAMFLYSAFNPDNSLQGLLYGNDNISNCWANGLYSASNDFRSQLVAVELTKDVTYTIVVTSFQPGVQGSLSFSITGPGSVDLSANENSTGFIEPTGITSATYDATTHVLSVTGANMDSGDTIDANALTLTGEGGNTYTLAGTYAVTASSTTAFSLMLDATDAINVAGLLNADGTAAADGETYNLAGGQDWDVTKSASADATASIFVSNVQAPVISSAAYNAKTGVLAVTGSNMVKQTGATDIDTSRLTLVGQGGGTYTLTGATAGVEISSATTFTVALGAADKAAVNTLLDKNGTVSSGGVVYDLAAADDWNGPITAADTSDNVGNGITVSNVNRAPGITSGATVSFDENGTGTVYTATTDPDDDSITWSISGADSALFTINSSTGALKFRSAPDYESPADAGTNNVYDLTIIATDNGVPALTASQALAVTVTDVNDPPRFTSATTVGVVEGVDTAFFYATGNDPDGDTITWSIGGVDADLFALDADTGALAFKTPADYEAPADNGGNNVYDLTITATDDGVGALTTSQALAVTVLNVNEKPAVTSAGTASFAENGTDPVYIAAGTDVENDTITWSISGVDSALFNINGVNRELAFKTAPDFEAPADSDADNRYELIIVATDDGVPAKMDSKVLTVTVTDANEAPTNISLSKASVAEGAASGTEVGKLSTTDPDAGNAFTYSFIAGDNDNASFSLVGNSLQTAAVFDFSAKDTYTVEVRGTDGGGLSTTRTFTVNVNEVNVAPTAIALDTTSVAENTPSGGVVGTLTTSDPNSSDSFSYSLVAGTGAEDNASFTISDDQLLLAVSPNFEAKGSYSIRVRTTDSGDLWFEQQFTITVTAVNEAPAIGSGTTASFAENATGVVYTATGTDVDAGDAITWSIDGDDAAAFSIDANTGALSFTSPRNYEVPADYDGDNVYDVTIIATDSGALDSSIQLAVTVTDVNEAPTVTSSSAVSVAENSDDTVYTATATDPDSGDAVTWSVSGADAALFDIDDQTGALTFKHTPDYETPGDSGANNIYNLTIVATDDGSLSGSTALAVTVTNVNDAPIITSATAVSFTEGGTGTVYTATGSDPEGDTVTWSIAGTDAGLFGIDSNTGALTFDSAPAYAAPADSDVNNVYELTIVASDGNSSSNRSLEITVGRRGQSGGDSSANPPGASVIVNGESQVAGNAATTTENGQTVSTVTVDTARLEAILDAEGDNATVVIPISTHSDVAAGVLTGQMVKSMEVKEATLVVETDSATYTLPAAEISIDAVSEQLGTSVALSDIEVRVEVVEPADDTVKIVENAAAANELTIVARPVEFSVSCTYGDRTIELSKFNAYVERTIAIPDGIDPSKITTGVVLGQDGSIHHVPTRVTVINGRYYAVINSLTNSTYSVVWHPVEFTDVASHWAKDAVNDMGSRMVVGGVGENNYAPDRDITRAEFAAIVVRALGLAPGEGDNRFSDVKATDWYCGYIETAASRGLITGYDAITFGPNDRITREQAMAIVARAMKVTGLTVSLADSDISALLAPYSDAASATAYARPGIAACIKTGIASGRTSDTIAPQGNITRAEVAVIVRRLLQASNLI